MEAGWLKARELLKHAETRWFDQIGMKAIQGTTSASGSSIDSIHSFLEENKDGKKNDNFIWGSDPIELLDARLQRLTKVDAPQVSLTTSASKNYYKLGTYFDFTLLNMKYGNEGS